MGPCHVVLDPLGVIEVDWLDGSDTLSTLAAEWWLVTHQKKAVSCYEMHGTVSLSNICSCNTPQDDHWQFIKSASGYDLVVCYFSPAPEGRIIRARNRRKDP